MCEEERRVYNFSPGPGELYKPVLKKAQSEILNWQGLGYSVMEMSHRQKEYIMIDKHTRASLKSYLEVPNNFTILLLQGGGCN